MKSKGLYAFHVILIVGIAWAIGYRQARGKSDLTAGPAYPNAAAPSAFNYQGALREDGVPVTGTRAMTFDLYASSGCNGTILQTLGPIDVTVTNGLFNYPLAFAAGHFTGQALSLAVKIPGTGSVCHDLLPVPYALSLRPGAAISGEVAGEAALYVENQNTTANKGTDGVQGISWAGKSAGVIGLSHNVDGYGVYGINYSGGTGVRAEGNPAVVAQGATAVRAEGNIWSNASTVLTLSPYGLVERDEKLLELRPEFNGSMSIFSANAGVHYVSLPVQAPETLFGSQVYLLSLEVCYQTGSVTNWVDAISVIHYKPSVAGYETYMLNTEAHNNTTVQCYHAYPTSPQAIKDATWVQLNLHSTTNLASWVIYTVKLTLSQEPTPP